MKRITHLFVLFRCSRSCAGDKRRCVLPPRPSRARSRAARRAARHAGAHVMSLRRWQTGVTPKKTRMRTKRAMLGSKIVRQVTWTKNGRLWIWLEEGLWRREQTFFNERGLYTELSLFHSIRPVDYDWIYLFALYMISVLPSDAFFQNHENKTIKHGTRARLGTSKPLPRVFGWSPIETWSGISSFEAPCLMYTSYCVEPRLQHRVKLLRLLFPYGINFISYLFIVNRHVWCPATWYNPCRLRPVVELETN